MAAIGRAALRAADLGNAIQVIALLTKNKIFYFAVLAFWCRWTQKLPQPPPAPGGGFPSAPLAWEPNGRAPPAAARLRHMSHLLLKTHARTPRPAPPSDGDAEHHTKIPLRPASRWVHFGDVPKQKLCGVTKRARVI